MKMKLEFIGEDDWGLPVYKDETGKLWEDVGGCSLQLDEGQEISKYSLCTVTNNAIDGEPIDCMAHMEKYNDVEITLSFNEVSKPLPNRFDYMLLGRLKSDCDYFLGYGDRYEKHLWAGNVEDQIKKMKELHDGFAPDMKPEWLTYDEILGYEKEMKREI